MFEYGPHTEFWDRERCIAFNKDKLNHLWNQFVSNFPADNFDDIEEWEISIATSVAACVYADIDHYDGSQIPVYDDDHDAIAEFVADLLHHRELWKLVDQGILFSDEDNMNFQLTEEGEAILAGIEEQENG